MHQTAHNFGLLFTIIHANQYDQSKQYLTSANGFVEVTGQSDNDPTSGNCNDHYVTIKYNVSDGTPIGLVI